ncbi:hypothetical protein [Streptomyces parvus]|uniref:Uncharacterized protein n=1 Tax=Streptomyces parvus TaxID=66428 RepID=A0A7K3S1E0_9ACTN|nr:hypothetical protein [Streptomyces parvus]NEC21199.1 hypothetical protein [Streptomyces parvus]NEE34491.1 hypothetical protein [Streptomyces sp. SID7982]
MMPKVHLPEWHNTIGYPQLGRADEYSGYVVQVQGTEDGHPEKWFTYAFDRDDRLTYWIGDGATEAEAKARLERLVEHGWICEVFVSDEAGHCKEQAMTVRSTWDRPRTNRLRVLLCEKHRNVLPDWDRMTIRQHIRTYNGLMQDEPIIGARL